MNDPSTAPLRSGQLAPWLVVAAAIIAAVNAIDALPVGIFYDDAMYVVLGKSLSEGHGYRYLNLPDAPFATHYPPGYPALLALLWRLAPTFPENIALFKMTNALLLGVVALWTYRFARARFEWREGLAASSAIAATVAVPALVLSSSVMSEVLFLALLLPLLMRAERVTASFGVRGGDALVLGVGAGVLFYVRVHAVALIPAIAAAYLLRARTREAIVSAGAAALIVLPWFIWVAANDAAIPQPLRGSYGSYGAWLAEGFRIEGIGLLFSAVGVNIATLKEIVARSFSISRNPVLDALAIVAVLVLCVAGAVAWARRARVTLLFLAAYLGIALVWPFSPLRFVWGIWPLLVLLMFSGVARLLETRSGLPRSWRAPLTVLGVSAGTIAALGALTFNALGYANGWWATVGRSIAPRIQPQLRWTAAHSNSNDVIASEDEGAVYLYTGRRAVPVAVFTARQYFTERSAADNAANLATIVAQLRPRYVIAWAVPTVQAASLLANARPPLLQPVDTIAGGRVFRRAY